MIEGGEQEDNIMKYASLLEETLDRAAVDRLLTPSIRQRVLKALLGISEVEYASQLFIHKFGPAGITCRADILCGVLKGLQAVSSISFPASSMKSNKNHFKLSGNDADYQALQTQRRIARLALGLFKLHTFPSEIKLTSHKFTKIKTYSNNQYERIEYQLYMPHVSM
jgi:hypothetical protein